jgi:transposase
VCVIGIARTTVQRALERSKAADLVWPLADGVSDEVLEEPRYEGLGKSVGFGAGVRKRQEPDWAHLVRELRRPAFTMVIDANGWQSGCCEFVIVPDRQGAGF